MKNRIEVKAKKSSGEDIVVYVVRPSNKDLINGQLVASATLKKAIDAGAILRSQLDEYMTKSGLWNEEKEKQATELNQSIMDDLIKLKKGGIKLKDATDLAVTIKAKRTLKMWMEMKRRELDEYTAESQAENARFDYLVSVCTKNEDGSLVFKDVDDYKNLSSEEYAYKSASALAALINNYDTEWEKKLPENQFLIKYNLVDDKLRLVNKEGDYITSDGKKIDKDFNYVNDDGKKLNEKGEVIDNDGLPIVESKPFLDDDGNPV